MIEVNDYMENSGLRFSKQKKNGSDDFNPEVTENDSLELTTHFTIMYTQIHVFATYSTTP